MNRGRFLVIASILGLVFAIRQGISGIGNALA
jgi:hypothetical protein